ncbi:MAG: iron uptake porin [Rhizonema sp. PD38]|nr:iron uptake porin [Rhizonema sp. PD38]
MSKYPLASAAGVGFLCLLMNSLPLLTKPANAEMTTDKQGQSFPLSQQPNPETSVSQLSDVQPTDWAFQALQSLVERYGCIVGYPDRTYRGNRSLTRYEFAAGLNACLNRVNELIATATSDLVTKEDLNTLQRLQKEFSSELTTLRGRVDVLEARTAELEANQFSTTTKLKGEAIISVVGATAGAPNTRDPNIILVDRIRLNLNTSFTGKDLLITGLQAYNFGGGTQSIGGALGLADPLGLSASEAKLSFEPQFPGLDPRDLSTKSSNSVQLYKLLYVFPVAKSLTLFAGPAAETTDAGFGITPFYDEGQEAVSRFAGVNPVARVSGGTSESGQASAAGFIWSITKNVDLRALYGSVNANIPGDRGFPGTPLGAGFFNGSTVAEAQLGFKPNKNIDLALNYANSHHQINFLGTALGNADVGTLFGVPATQDIHVNSVGGTATWRFSPKIAFSGYGAAFFVNNDGGPSASTTLITWMAGLHFTDLLKKGNSGGILFGQPIYRVDASGAATLPNNRTNPYHLEAYYRFQITDNISITPGGFVLFNPEGNRNNDTTAVGLIRTTFTF